MAKRKSKSKTIYRTKTVTVAKRRKNSSSKGGLLGLGNTPLRPYAIGYGFIRAKIANALDPLTSKIPAGEFADEVGIGVLAWFIGKKVPALKQFADTALEIENYRVGEILANKTMGQNIQVNSSSSYVYM